VVGPQCEHGDNAENRRHENGANSQVDAGTRRRSSREIGIRWGRSRFDGRRRRRGCGWLVASCGLFASIDHLDACSKAVAAFLQSLDEHRGRGVITERQANLPDAVVQTLVELDECGLIPDPLAKLFAGDQRARLHDQNLEDAQWLRLDSYGTAVAEQFPRIEIEFELGKTEAAGLASQSACRWRSVVYILIFGSATPHGELSATPPR
jgi:hypothetical protein